jgi:hypothetical protein
MADEQSLHVISPRGRGRPRVPDPMERVSTRLPTPVYDRLVKAAKQRDQSVAELARQILMAQSFMRRR